MDKSKTIVNMVRERLGNKPTYNPVEFLEMCATVRDELESRPTKDTGDLAICSACGEPLQYHVGGAKRGLCKNPPSA